MYISSVKIVNSIVPVFIILHVVFQTGHLSIFFLQRKAKKRRIVLNRTKQRKMKETGFYRPASYFMIMSIDNYNFNCEIFILSTNYCLLATFLIISFILFFTDYSCRFQAVDMFLRYWAEFVIFFNEQGVRIIFFYPVE